MWGIKKWILSARFPRGASRDEPKSDVKRSNESSERLPKKNDGDSKKTLTDISVTDEDSDGSGESDEDPKNKGTEEDHKRVVTPMKCESSRSELHVDGSPLPSVITDSTEKSSHSQVLQQLSQTTVKSTSSRSLPLSPLITSWWECTPANMNAVLLNFLYDIDNPRCNSVWTLLENISMCRREQIFYSMLIAFTAVILFSEPAHFVFYTAGFAVPMFTTFRVFKYHRYNEYSRMLRYWVVFGWFAIVDVFLHSYMERRPIYWTLKAVFVAYLLLPFIRGSDLIYHDYARSFNNRIEIVIDSFGYYHE